MASFSFTAGAFYGSFDAFHVQIWIVLYPVLMLLFALPFRFYGPWCGWCACIGLAYAFAFLLLLLSLFLFLFLFLYLLFLFPLLLSSSSSSFAQHPF